MSRFRREPFLFVHLASISLAPVCLLLCMMGFTAGDPFLPFEAEAWLVVGLGCLPILWMQLWRPFYLFSLVAVTLKPESLTDDQRRLLNWLHQPGLKLLSIGLSCGLGLAIWQCYLWAPLFATISPAEGWSRIEGLGLAAIAAIGLNLFSQAPLNAVFILNIDPDRIHRTAPYDIECIERDFSCWGAMKSQILPGILMAPLATTSTTAEIAPEADTAEQAAIYPQNSSQTQGH